MTAKRMAFGFLLALGIWTVSASAQQGGAGDRWIGTWATAGTWRAPATPAPATVPPLSPATPPPPPQGGGQAGPPAPLHFNNQTLRQIVHTTLGGDRFRIVLSNVFGTAPMTIGAAAVALRDKESAIVAGSTRPLTFSGQPSAMIPAGAVVFSDPVNITAPAMSDLAIDLFLPLDTSTWPSALTIHNGAFQTNFVSSPGNHVGEPSMTVASTTNSWFLLARVEVMAPVSTAAIVALGDSITDGTRSTPNTNSRWPDELARRLQSQPATKHLSVLNAGIAGNRVLSEGNPTAGINLLARFDRDVLTQTGVKFVIVLEGINDIGQARQSPLPGAAELIAGHRQLIERAHTNGLKIFGATLTPFDGAAYFTQEGEAKRQAVNEWIRNSKAYDGVVDFDAAVRDPAQPTKFLPAYNGGDNLHPSDAGYKAMAAAIDLGLFK